MRRIGQKAPFPVQRCRQAFQQAVDGADEWPQFARHARGGHRGQVHAGAVHDGVSRAVHGAEGAADHQPRQARQRQEKRAEEPQPVPHARHGVVLHLIDRLGELHLHQPVCIRQGIDAPGFAAHRDVLETVLKAWHHGGVGRGGRAHDKPLVGQGPDLEVRGFPVETGRRRQLKTVFFVQGLGLQQAGGQGQQHLLRAVAHALVQHAGFGARLLHIDQQDRDQPRGQHGQQQGDGKPSAQRRHGVAPATMR
ncbi:hypothetical protein D3C87_1301230 [compost metagenome]